MKAPILILFSAFLAATALYGREKTDVLVIAANAFPSVSQPGRIYANLDASYYVKIFSNFTWNLTFYGNWDNQPPPHFNGSNYGMSLGLGSTFGNR